MRPPRRILPTSAFARVRPVSPPDVVLYKRLPRIVAQHRRTRYAILAVSIILLAVALPALLFKGDFLLAADVLRATARERPGDVALHLLPLLALLAFPLVQRYAARHERLRIDGSGIHYDAPASLSWLLRSWSLRWSDIRAAYLQRGLAGRQGTNTATVILATANGRRHMRPYEWVAANAAHAQPTVEEAPLLQALRAHGVVLDERGDNGVAQFALENNPRSATVALAIVALLVYAFADLVVNSETYLARPPYLWFVACGAVAGALAFLWLRAAKLPGGVAASLALVWGGVFAIAAFPLALRANQLTDTRGLQVYVYQYMPPANFRAADDAMPDMELRRFDDYWATLAPGSLRLFAIRRGALGFYQIDLAPVYSEIHEHNAAQYGRQRLQIDRSI